ncbi:serine/threonine-protein kinase pim-3-like [Gasterosteus aculeatus]
MSFCSSVVIGRRSDKRKFTAAEGGPRRKRRLVTEDSEDSEDSHRKRARGRDNASVDGPRKKRKRRLRTARTDDKGNVIPTEVAVMLKLAAESDGTSSHVSLLDWYQLVGELVLVMERPMPAENYNNYLPYNKFYVKNEEDVRIILRQLVDAAIALESKNVFHRDIKAENMLIETRSDFPRVRLISFGVSCFDDKRQAHEDFCSRSSPTRL